MNFEKYPWLNDLESDEAIEAIRKAKEAFDKTGGVIFPNFITDEAIKECVEEVETLEPGAFMVDRPQTPYLRPVDEDMPKNSVRNFLSRAYKASIATDELSEERVLLKQIYRHPTLCKLVAKIVGKEQLYTSADPVGSCCISASGPTMCHGFHLDESEFSTTIMLRESPKPGTGLFQYTDPIRTTKKDMAYETVAKTLNTYEETARDFQFAELEGKDDADVPTPRLHTLDFRVGTLSLFAGFRSLHRVTPADGDESRLVAILAFASAPGFHNSSTVQKMFWGRTGQNKSVEA